MKLIKTIKEESDIFINQVFPGDISKQQRDDLECTFYAGAMTIMRNLERIAEHLTEDQGTVVLEILKQEAEMFSKKVMKLDAQKEEELKQIGAIEQQEFLRGLARFLKDVIAEGYGTEMAFILLVARMNDSGGTADYVSNGQREDCIKWMKETVERFAANDTIGPTEGSA